MGDISANEQYLIELVNNARAAQGLGPLAPNSNLDDSATTHNLAMLAGNFFSHTGQDGSSASQRIQAAGYTLNGGGSTGENIAIQSLRGAAGITDDIADLHTSWMNSAGHRANILSTSFTEIGVGLDVGNYTFSSGGLFTSLMGTQNFGRENNDNPFLTGAWYNDADADNEFDVGEEIAGGTVTATSSSGTVVTTTTWSGGGYALELAPETYTVKFTKGSSSSEFNVTIGSQNVELDLNSVPVTLPVDLPDPDSSPFQIYRFYNSQTGAHFFTTSIEERNSIITTSSTMTYEGNSYDSNATDSNGGTAVFRFYNTQNGIHFYTANTDEANNIRANLPHFNDEGLAYYARSTADTGGTALFRFLNTENGSHFYTNSESERDNTINTLGHYTYEGVAFYVDLA